MRRSKAASPGTPAAGKGKRKPWFEVYRATEPLRGEWAALSRDAARPARVYRWRLRAANGEIVAQGESYTRKADCLRAVRQIKKLAAQAGVRGAP